MNWKRLFLNVSNRLLRRLDLGLRHLGERDTEHARLANLAERGCFVRPAFKVSQHFANSTGMSVCHAVPKYSKRFDTFLTPDANDVGFTFANGFFTSPDAEILYTMIREHQPKQIIEIGCGNSTKIIRQAIIDAALRTQVICVDPEPRTAILDLADEYISAPVESMSDEDVRRIFLTADMVLIDSTHQLKTGNDVAFLYLQVVPFLKQDTIVHIHDVFLPYEYPEDWLLEQRWSFNEQYLVQLILSFSNTFEVLWAGHYLQRTREDFASFFPHMDGRLARSLWLRKIC